MSITFVEEEEEELLYTVSFEYDLFLVLLIYLLLFLVLFISGSHFENS